LVKFSSHISLSVADICPSILRSKSMFIW
jgi:hypothetical protein